jgi:hypothetical protein
MSGMNATSPDVRNEVLHASLNPDERVVTLGGAYYRPRNRAATRRIASVEGHGSYEGFMAVTDQRMEGFVAVTDQRMLFFRARGARGGGFAPLLWWVARWTGQRLVPGKRPYLLVEYPRDEIRAVRGGGFMRSDEVLMTTADGAKWWFQMRHRTEARSVLAVLKVPQAETRADRPMHSGG